MKKSGFDCASTFFDRGGKKFDSSKEDRAENVSRFKRKRLVFGVLVCGNMEEEAYENYIIMDQSEGWGAKGVFSVILLVAGAIYILWQSTDPLEQRPKKDSSVDDTNSADATPTVNAEEIRQARLKRFERSPPALLREPQKETTETQEVVNPDGTKTKARSWSDVPPMEEDITPTSTAPSTDELLDTPTETPTQTTEPSSAESSSTTTKSPIKPIRLTPEERNHRSICNIFHVSLDEGRYLREIAMEKKEQSEHFFSDVDIDPIIIESTMNLSPVQQIEHFDSCYKRLQAEKNTETSISTIQEHCSRSIVSFTGLAVQSNPEALLEIVERDPSSLPLSNELLLKVHQEFGTDVETSLQWVMSAATSKLKNGKRLLDVEVNPRLQLVDLPEFLPNGLNGREMQEKTAFGPLFSYSVDLEDVREYFRNPTQMTLNNAQSSYNTVRSQLSNVQNSVHQILRNCLRTDDHCKKKILDWITAAVLSNYNRTKMHYDEKSISTEGFVMNLCIVLFKFCSPFTTNRNFQKIVNSYMNRNERISIKEETRLGATPEDVTKYVDEISSNSTEPPSFVTEIFFLTLHGLHTGVVRTLSRYNSFIQSIAKLQAKKREMEENRAQWGALADVYLQR
ncbi:ubiquitin conjugation factor E4, partial [Planoprotostelium fungivorum]